MIEGNARWSVALLVLSTSATFSLTRPWATASATRVPDLTDSPTGRTPSAGEMVAVHAAGVHGVSGAVLLGACIVIVLLALWRLSPGYRPLVAGYATICLSACGIAVTTAFLMGAPDRMTIFGSDVDVMRSSIGGTAWPWVAMVCMAMSCAVGIMLTPTTLRRPRRDGAEADTVRMAEPTARERSAP